jgi:hypothetical protein
MKLRFAEFVIAALISVPAVAQDWDWRVTPYLWGSAIEGDIALGQVSRDVDVEFSDLVNVLAGAALVHVEVAEGDNVLFGDLIWLSVEPEDEIATVGGVAEAELETTILEAGYARSGSGFGLEIGLRHWEFDMEIDPAQLAAVERGDSWTDVFAGFRNTRDLGRRWTMTTRANIGSGGADLALGLQVDFAREISTGSAVVAGLKVLDIDYDDTNVRGLAFVLDTTFLGATIGYRFD